VLALMQSATGGELVRAVSQSSLRNRQPGLSDHASRRIAERARELFANSLENVDIYFIFPSGCRC